jgi:hypothetical protein
MVQRFPLAVVQEGQAVKIVGTALGDPVDDTTPETSVLGSEVPRY